ncbi:MAG: polysaccharide biosynthesis/export family protein [Elusimicrobia bacterium]|jgi:polysaccharide export outer membrane protein|nr:polysaccharide biosynthesis/export family protein [Elusimicrobiota bacterium]
MNRYVLFLLCFAFSFLFSCASTQKSTEISSITVESGTEEDVENIQNRVLNDISDVQKSNNYILQAGDLVEIKVFMEKDMDRELRISSDGMVTFPLVGNVKIGGYSVAEAEQQLSEKLKYYIKNPQVSMLIKEYANKMVYVLGQVQKPSEIAIPPEKSITVLEAITSVGGFTDIANTSKVKVLRMENGKQKSLDVDVNAITKQGKKSLDIELMPGDVIFVPQSMF